MPDDPCSTRRVVHALCGHISQILNPSGHKRKCVQEKPLLDARKAHIVNGTMTDVKGDGARVGNAIEGGQITLELIIVAFNIGRGREHSDRDMGSIPGVNHHTALLIIDVIVTSYLDNTLAEGRVAEMRGVGHIYF
jgi:hypothetical protein